MKKYGSTITAEDMLFIIHDTVKLFKPYDLVKITDLEGNTKTYPGVKFYSSEEYKNCFNGLEFGSNEYSFDIEKDIWEVIKTRATVLNSASYKDINGFCVFTDMESSVNEDYFLVSDYRVAIFISGFDGHFRHKEVISIRFGADDYRNYCKFHFGGGFDEISEPHQLSGSQAIFDYVNVILKDILIRE